MNGTVPRENIGRFGGLSCNCSILVEPGREPNMYCDSFTEWNSGTAPASACATRTSTVCRDFSVLDADKTGSTTGFVKTADGLGGMDNRLPRDVSAYVPSARRVKNPLVMSSRKS